MLAFVSIVAYRWRASTARLIFDIATAAALVAALDRNREKGRRLRDGPSSQTATGILPRQQPGRSRSYKMFNSIVMVRGIASFLPAVQAGLFALAMHLDQGVQTQLGLRAFCLFWSVMHADWPAFTATMLDCVLDVAKLSRVALTAARLALCIPRG